MNEVRKHGGYIPPTQ